MIIGMTALMMVTVAGTMDVEIVADASESHATDCSCVTRPVARLLDCAVRNKIAAHAAI